MKRSEEALAVALGLWVGVQCGFVLLKVLCMTGVIR